MKNGYLKNKNQCLKAIPATSAEHIQPRAYATVGEKGMIHPYPGNVFHVVFAVLWCYGLCFCRLKHKKWSTKHYAPKKTKAKEVNIMQKNNNNISLAWFSLHVCPLSFQALFKLCSSPSWHGVRPHGLQDVSQMKRFICPTLSSIE